MSRKGQTRKRTIPADPIYGSAVVTRLINQVMLDGKKSIAQKIVYGAFERIREKADKEPVEVFEAAMNNIIPVLEVKMKRIGDATYQVSIEVKSEGRQVLALHWLTNFSRTRGEKTQEERLAAELMDTANNTGSAIRRRGDMHKIAGANKALTHYRF